MDTDLVMDLDIMIELSVPLDEQSIKPLLVGLAYQYQICEMHFGEKHDLKYDLVFSENNEMFSYLHRLN